MMRTTSVVLASLSVAACSGAPLARPAVDLAPFEALGADDFPGAARVLAGFAPADDDPAIRVGDAALLGIELHRDGSVERQLVLLEVAGLGWERPHEVRINGVLQPDGGGVLVRPNTGFVVTDDAGEHKYAVHPVDTALTRYDAAGEQLRSSRARLFEQPLATGWWPYSGPCGDLRAIHLAFALSMAMQNLATDDAVLADLLFRVVDAPSLWSVAMSLGVKVTLFWHTTDVPQRVDVTWFAGEVRCAPLELRINGSSASWVDLFVAQPNGATMVCGGLVGAIARHPTEPGRIAVVRLLATRRGARP